MSEDELNRQRAMNEDKARGLRARILELEAKELRWDKGLENWEKAYKRLEKERDELLTKEAHAIHDKLAAEKRFLSVEKRSRMMERAITSAKGHLDHQPSCVCQFCVLVGTLSRME